MLLGPLALFFYRIVGPVPGEGLGLYRMLVPVSRARPAERPRIAESWNELAAGEEASIRANSEKALDLIVGWNTGVRDPAMALDRGGPLWDPGAHYGDLVEEEAPDLYTEFFYDRTKKPLYKNIGDDLYETTVGTGLPLAPDFFTARLEAQDPTSCGTTAGSGSRPSAPRR